MDIKSLEIKSKTYYNWDDISYINDFDVNSLKITRRESRIGANIYYTIKPLYFVINRLLGYIEEIKGSSDKYLVIVDSFLNKNETSVFYTIWRSIENKIGDIINPEHNSNIKIKDYDKFRFNSDTYLPLNTIIEFRSLVINVSCVIEKNNEYYPEIYLDESLCIKDNPCSITNVFHKLNSISKNV